MSNFERAIIHILKHEGGYVFDPLDSGGETNFGISKRQYPNEDIKNLTKERAIFLYKRDYWRKYMDAMPYPIGAKLFDCSVNMGHKQANLLLQRAVGIIDDGVIGHHTLVAINEDNPKLLLNRYIRRIKDFYDKIIERKPSQIKFKKSWYHRAEWVPED